MRTSLTMKKAPGPSWYRRSILAAAAFGTLVGTAPVSAQQTPLPVTPPVAPTPDARAREEMLRGLGMTRDPLAHAFFPPELVMQRQQEIGLTADQRNAIVNVIAEAQPRFVEAQWQLQPETAALAELVRGDRVDEQQVLAQIDRVLDIERQIKRLQIEMLIRIKNQLTLEQQQQLARFGGVRLRGMLDSSRLKIAPFGLAPSGDMLNGSIKFAPGGLSTGQNFWFDDSTHWFDDSTHWFDSSNHWLETPAHWPPVDWTPPAPTPGE